MAASGSPLPNTHRIEAGVGGTLSLYVDKMTDTKIVFNGDTASGRAQWVPWLRSLALTLDEWAWSVLQNDVLPHGKVKKIMEKRPASRTDEEKEDLEEHLKRLKRMQSMLVCIATSAMATQNTLHRVEVSSRNLSCQP